MDTILCVQDIMHSYSHTRYILLHTVQFLKIQTAMLQFLLQALGFGTNSIQLQ
jgi:hypothetical protein